MLIGANNLISSLFLLILGKEYFFFFAELQTSNGAVNLHSTKYVLLLEIENQLVRERTNDVIYMLTYRAEFWLKDNRQMIVRMQTHINAMEYCQLNWIRSCVNCSLNNRKAK